jgi:hypothetical protein
MKRHLAAAAAVFMLSTHAVSAAQLAHAKFTITSALSVDTTNHTVTLPLHKQTIAGTSAWYIITDASDASVAKKYGVNFAPSLADLGAPAIASLAMRSAPDFSEARTYVASKIGFPPVDAKPGAVADEKYSPFVREDGSAGVINAPIVAVGDKELDVTKHTNTEDRVIAIDTTKMTVTLVLARGFFNGTPVYYLSTEASAPVPASVERATLSARLGEAASAAEIPIGVVVSGPQTGPAPQGLAFLALKTPLTADATAANVGTIMSSFNVLSVAPDLKNPYAANGYTPLWNVMVVGEPQKKRLTTYAQIAPLAKAAGFVVNCPVVAYGDDGY